MSMQKFTPGPWAMVRKEVVINGLWEPNGINIESRGGQTVVGEEGLYAGESDEANARLIAMAPELLEALIECAKRLSIHIKHTEDLFAHMQACKAIAKATGDSNA